jgi:Zn-dependent protease with chaperone function
MHFLLILAVLLLANILRGKWKNPKGNWIKRWQKALFLFLFPPLLLLMTAIAIFWMGVGGQMVGFWDGWLSYLIAASFLITALLTLIKISQEANYILKQTRSYPIKKIAKKNVRIINSPTLIAALVGLWKPELVISTGLLETLPKTHIEAVIAHEQAHYEYRDSFTFFFLGWVRNFTNFLPKTQLLWEELLILRELRADAKAAQKIDKLILAEALLLTSQTMQKQPEIASIIGIITTGNRLHERIESLLAETLPMTQEHKTLWLTLIPASLPLLIVPFHQ